MINVLPPRAVDDALIDRCLAREPEAWDLLHREYRPRIRRYLQKLGLPDRESEDACQEVFTQIVRYLDRFERRSSLRTWIFKLCLSQRDRWKRSWVALCQFDEEKLDEGMQASLTPEPQMVTVAMRALQRMSPLHRTSLVLFALKGLPGNEVARALDCPVGTVWRRLHHARKEFEACLEADS
jgi:RNA polymerase sigma-70 factor, ECF subfamily